MNHVTIRLLFAGAFALIALTGAIGIEVAGHECPEWLVAIVAAAGGYVFGHVQANGVTGKH